jgi:hypothetical protein
MLQNNAKEREKEKEMAIYGGFGGPRPMGGHIGYGPAVGGYGRGWPLPPKPPGSKPLDKGIGYDDDMSVFNLTTNLFFGGDEPMRSDLAQALKFEGQDDKTDNLTCLVLSLVVILLPNASKLDLPPELKAMLEVSCILDKTAELLRNDSLDNVTKRYEVYSATIKFTAKLARHPELASLVKEERMSKRKTAGLQAISEAGINGKSTSECLVHSKESASSIARCLENLAKQANIVLESGRKIGVGGGDAMFEVCREICDLSKELEARPVGLGAVTKNLETAEERYIRFHKENCLTRDDAVLDLLNRNFQNQARRITQAKPGRMKRLVMETANMSTSLPLGVFVKVGESRPDVMKALVMGPKDSPYAYGLFEYSSNP